MGRFKKWIKAPSGEPTLADMVRTSLQQRIGAVAYYLPLAACNAKSDTENVHQLRVWTRRAEAVFDLYDDILPAKSAKKIRKRLKQIRRAANDARDADVLLERLEGLRPQPSGTKVLLKRVRRFRSSAQKPIVRRHRQLMKQRKLERQVDRLLNKCRRPSTGDVTFDVTFDNWARKKLRTRVRSFFRAGNEDLTQPVKLHAFRIEGKRLRYTLELLSSAVPKSTRDCVYERVAELQDQLGAINDHATAHDSYLHWLADPKVTNAEKDALLNLTEYECVQLVTATAQFTKWWTPKRKKNLEVEFQQLWKDE